MDTKIFAYALGDSGILVILPVVARHIGGSTSRPCGSWSPLYMYLVAYRYFTICTTPRR